MMEFFEFLAHWPFRKKEEFNILFWLLIVCIVVTSIYNWLTKSRDQ